MRQSLILQPFSCFTYVTAHSTTLLSLHLRHSSFYSSSVASPTSQALHLRHLASHPCGRVLFPAGSGILIPILGLGVCVLCLCYVHYLCRGYCSIYPREHAKNFSIALYSGANYHHYRLEVPRYSGQHKYPLTQAFTICLSRLLFFRLPNKVNILEFPYISPIQQTTQETPKYIISLCRL